MGMQNIVRRSLATAPARLYGTQVHVTRGSIPLTIRFANRAQDKFRVKTPAQVVQGQRMALVEAAGELDGAMEILNGIPEEQLRDRRVRVYKPTRNTMQSGVQNMKSWRVEFNLKEKWENPTMGWGSTADPLSNIAGWMKFKTKEDAIAFCHRQGWKVTEVNDENVKNIPFREYGDNYSWNSRRRSSCK